MSLEIETQILADHMPGGRTFESKNIEGSNTRALLQGIAGSLFEIDSFINQFEYEFNPKQTTLFLEEWERAVGIPDLCFADNLGTDEERRRNILVKLSASGVQTKQDFIDLAALFGVTIDIKTGDEVASFALPFPLIFTNTQSDNRYLIHVFYDFQRQNFFPYNFPVVFGDKILTILRCLFEKLKPVNTRVIFTRTN